MALKVNYVCGWMQITIQSLSNRILFTLFFSSNKRKLFKAVTLSNSIKQPNKFLIINIIFHKRAHLCMEVP